MIKVLKTKNNKEKIFNILNISYKANNPFLIRRLTDK